MNHIEFLEKLAILTELISQKRTGTPEEVAERLHISRSALYLIIEELKSRGIDVKYSRSRCTFYYNNDVLIDIQISIKSLKEIDDPDELKDITGGCNIFMGQLNFLGSNCIFAGEKGR